MSREVRQVRDALQSGFGGLIDMSDENGPPDKVEQHFISRALAALVAQKLLGSDRDTAVDALVDGRDDGGIDAIAVADSETRIWLIQSKWAISQVVWETPNSGRTVAAQWPHSDVTQIIRI